MRIELNNYVVNKMKTTCQNQINNSGYTTLKPQYFFTDKISVNIDTHIKFIHHLKYQCTSCEKPTKKLYSGFCYLCLIRKPEADLCIMSPNRCHFSKGTCRSEEFGKAFCFQPHYLYIAATDKFKVGLTRQNQIPTRWIDQGATLASVFLQTHSRHQAGVIEKFLTQRMADKSHWRNMLKAQNNHPSYEEFGAELALVKSWLAEHPSWIAKELEVETPQDINITKETTILPQNEVFEIVYPLLDNIPEKIQSVRLEKVLEIQGKIVGIKGQYIILDNGMVLNLRNHSGYIVDIEIDG